MGTLSGFGLVMYVGLHPWQGINLAALFLLLGVGIDDTFVMLSAWERVKEDMPLHSGTFDELYYCLNFECN